MVRLKSELIRILIVIFLISVASCEISPSETTIHDDAEELSFFEEFLPQFHMPRRAANHFLGEIFKFYDVFNPPSDSHRHSTNTPSSPSRNNVENRVKRGVQTEESKIIEENNQKRNQNVKLKRESPTHNKTSFEECNNLGYQYFSDPLDNACKGKICILEIVNCQGKEYNVTNQAPPGFNLIEDCQAVKIQCNHQSVDLKAWHNAEECKITDFLCGEYFFNSTNFSPSVDVHNCAVRVACKDHKIYGFDDYGFPCERQDLYCNNKEVDLEHQNINDTQFQKQLPNCKVQKSACKFEDTRCKTVQRACDGDLVDGCNLKTTQVPCQKDQNGTSIQPLCQISQLECNGKEVNLTSYLGPFANCTVKEINCTGSLRTTPSQCKLADLNCQGISWKAQNYFGNMGFCSIQNLTCGDSTKCLTFTPRCEDSPDCQLIVRRFDCENSESCHQRINSTKCLCPEDRYGEHCEKQVPVECVAALRSPERDCHTNPWMNENYQNNPQSKLLNGDPACLVFPMSATVNLEYQLQCKMAFKNTGYTSPGNVTIKGVTISIPPPDDETDPYGFEYWVSTEDLKLSDPVDWGTRFKIFDFQWLSRPHVVNIDTLSKFQVAGVEMMHFPVVLKQIEDRYWAGNRLYFEIGWDPIKKPTDSEWALDRGFIDPSDRPFPSFGTGKNTTTIVLAVVLPILAVILLTLIIVYFWWKSKKSSTEYQPIVNQDE